jgi:hypothetical protein
MKQNKKGNKDSARASNVARGMILAGVGKKQVFTSRAEKRLKDAKNSWQKDQDR